MAIKNLLRRHVLSNAPIRSIDSASTTFDGLPPTSSLPPSAAQGKEPDFGTNAVIKTFYEGPKKSGRQINWMETPPKQLNKKVSRAYDRVAIKLYKKKDPEQPTIAGRTPMKIDVIEIQSPILVTALKDIVEDEGVFLEVHDIATFTSPFKPLYFSYDKIVALYDRTGDCSVLKEHLHLLVQLMVELFGDMMTQLRHLKESRLISFKLAWAYFPRDSVIYCGAEDCERLFRVVDTQYKQQSREPPVLAISCRHIIFNGMSFEWAVTCLEIPLFGGNLPITSLPHYPLSFHANAKLLNANLTARGEKVLDYQGLNYCEYSGTGISTGTETKRHNVGDRWQCIACSC